VEDLKHLSIVLEKALLCLTSPTMNFQTPLPSGPGRSLVHCVQKKAEQVQLPWEVQLMHTPACPPDSNLGRLRHMLECASAELPMAIEPAQPFSERKCRCPLLKRFEVLQCCTDGILEIESIWSRTLACSLSPAKPSDLINPFHLSLCPCPSAPHIGLGDAYAEWK
jgi:hypothetical protein